MKLCILLCACVAMACAAAPRADILRYDYDTNNIGTGNYQFRFEQSDGTGHQQRGETKNQGRDDEYLAVQGQYTWVGPDGVTYIVKYTADDNGYQPEIEQGPGGGVPPAVVASLLG